MSGVPFNSGMQGQQPVMITSGMPSSGMSGLQPAGMSGPQSPGMPPQQQPQLPQVQLSPINQNAKIFDMNGTPIKDEQYFVNNALQQISERNNSFNQSRLMPMPMQFQQQAPGATLDVSPTEMTQGTQSDTSKNLNAELDKYNNIFDGIFKSLYDNGKCDLDETITNKIKIEEHKNALEQKQDMIKQVEDKLQKEEQNYSTSVNSLTTERDKLIDALRKKDQEISELNNQLESKVSKETPDKGEIEKHKGKIRDLEENIKNLRMELKQKNDTISTMEEKRDAAKQNAKILSTTKNSNAQEIDLLKKKLEDAQEALIEKEKDKRNEINKLLRQFEESTGEDKQFAQIKIDKLNDILQQQKIETEKEKSRANEKYQQELKEFEDKIQLLTTDNNNINQKILDANIENQQLKSSILELRKENDSVKLEENSKRERMKNSHEHELSKIYERLTSAEQDRNEAKSTVAQLNSENKQLSQYVNEKNRENQQLQQQQQQQQMEQEQNQRELSDEKARYQNLEGEKKNLEKQLQELGELAKQYNTQIENIESEVRELRESKDSEKSQSNEKISDLENNLRLLEENVNKCNEEKEEIEKQLEKNLEQSENLSSEPQEKRNFFYGFHWETTSRNGHANLKEYTGDGIALTEFKDEEGNKLSNTEKENIIKALKNNPQDILIISVKPNNGILIEDFRRSNSAIKKFFPNSDFLIIKIVYREKYYTFKARRDRVRPFKNRLQQENSIQNGGGKVKKKEKKQKKGGFGLESGGMFGNNSEWQKHISSQPIQSSMSPPSSPMVSTSPPPMISTSPPPIVSTSPPPPPMPMVMPPQQLVSQQQPQGFNQNQGLNSNDIKNEFDKLEEFNTTLEKYKLSKDKDLSSSIKLYNDYFKKIKKNFDENKYKDNNQELCNDFNKIYQIFKGIKVKLSDPTIKKAGEYQNKFAKSIDNLVSKISKEFNDRIGLKEKLFSEDNDSVIEDIINAIYKFIIFIIAIACIIIVILNILNIIRYLYECFKEIGNLNHNNLSTGNTFRYKLFKYLFYIDSCSIPAIINQYNTPGASSGTLITLTTAISKFTLDFGNFFERNSIEGGGYKLSDEVKDVTSKLGQDGMRENLGNFKFIDDATNALIEEQRNNYKLNIKTDRINKWRDENKDRKDAKEDDIREELSIEYKNLLQKEYRETVKNNNEPFFNIFFMLRLNFFVIRLVITLINIFFVATLILIILKLINEKKKEDINLMPNLTYKINSIFVISVFFVIINIVLYKFIYIKIYEKQLNTYLYIHSIDLRITEFITKYKDSTSGTTTIDKTFYDYLKDNIDDKNKILKHIKNIKNIFNDKDKCISYITLYVLVSHIYNSFEKRKNSHLDVLNSFVISQEQSTDIFKINKQEFKEETYYSFIGSKFRKESIQYFEDDITSFEDDKKSINTNNITIYNEIKVEVNKFIAELNDLIDIVNNEFYDDYYIIQFGVYFLINLVISVIYIITLMTFAMKMMK